MSDHADLIARAEASLEGVTPGPWAAYIGSHCIQVDIGEAPNGQRPNIVDWAGFDGSETPKKEQRFNARFIAASRQLVPDLIATLRAEREARERAEAMVAAALEDAARNVSGEVTPYWAADLIAKIIRNRTPADASAALDRIRQEAADEAQKDKEGLQKQISELLKLIDGWDEEQAKQNGGFTMHVRGNTPDWYVLAAFWSCYGFGPDDPRALKGSGND